MREQQGKKANFAAANVERKRQIADDSARLLKLASDLKTEVDKTVVVKVRNADSLPVKERPVMEAFVAAYRELADYAGQRGVQMLVENYGWMDAEMMLKGSAHKDKFPAFINAMEQAPWIAKNFLDKGRPLFNEKAYKLLVNSGHKERADRFFYNDPERPLTMVLKGPSSNAQAYIDAFNEVFGS